MVWVLEKLREDVPIFANHKPCKWENIEVSTHFKVQKRLLKGSHRESKACEFCKDLQVLGGGKCLICDEHAYRIIFESLIKLVVAKSSNLVEIKNHMKHLTETIQPMLNMLEEQDTSLEKKPTNKKKGLRRLIKVNETTQQSQKNESTQKEICNFVKFKVASMIKNEEKFQEKFKKLLNEEIFKTFFPTVGIDEKSILSKKNNITVFYRLFIFIFFIKLKNVVYGNINIIVVFVV